ncbi:MAG: hypothetical protein E4G92_03110, partial [Bacteroidia bacterium]
MQNFSLTGKSLSQNLMLTINDQAMTDHVNNSGNSYKTLVAMGSYVISYMPLKVNLALTYSYSSFDMPTSENTLHGPSASLSALLLKGNIRMSLAGSRFSNIIDNDLYGNITTASLSAVFKITKMHMVKARLYINNSTG